MEFSITKKSLLDCLSHFQSVVERRNTIPILSNIKISALEGGLSLTATDLALELSESLTANVSTTGGITIPSQLFFEIVRKAPESSQISMKQDEKNGSVIVFFGKSKFSLPTLPIEDFPVMDSDNLNSIYNLFQYLKSQFQFAMIVSHIDSMRDTVDTLLEVKKENGFSNIIFD